MVNQKPWRRTGWEAATTKTLPAHYDFYEGDQTIRKIFVHALREQSKLLPEPAPKTSGTPRATKSARPRPGSWRVR